MEPLATLTRKVSEWRQRGKARPHLQVDCALQGKGLGLLDVLVAELVDAPGPAGLRTIGRHHGHAGEHWQRAERGGRKTFPMRAAVLRVPLSSSRHPPLTWERRRRCTHAGSASGTSGGRK